MQEPAFVRSLFASIATRYDVANHLLSGGLDYLWRRRATSLVRAWQPRRILDLATGSGDLALSLRAAIPDAVIIGADFCHPMLLQAQRKTLDCLVTADGMRLPFAAQTFDVVTVAFGLRNMESYEGALREMRRVLRSSGHLLILDFSLPRPPLRAPYRLYLHHVLPRIAGWLTGAPDAYTYLGDSIEIFPAGEQMQDLLRRCGFKEPQAEPLTRGIVSIYTAAW